MNTSIIGRLRSFVGDGVPTRVYECRHCGTSVDPDTEECPSCGRSEMVALEVG